MFVCLDVKEDEIGRAYSTSGRVDKFILSFGENAIMKETTRKT
jgi:hypothetical protein